MEFFRLDRSGKDIISSIGASKTNTDPSKGYVRSEAGFEYCLGDSGANGTIQKRTSGLQQAGHNQLEEILA